MRRKYLLKGMGLLVLSLYLSFDPGWAQWTKTSGPPGIQVNAFCRSGNLLLAATSSKGVFRSMDNGLTWAPSNSGMDKMEVFSLISDGVYVYAGTRNGVFRSS